MNEHSKLLCKRCKHSFVPLEQRVLSIFSLFQMSRFSYRCKKAFKEDESEFNPVTGPVKVDRHYETCASARMLSGVCGKEGKLWEPKHKKDLFLVLTEK